MDGDGDLDIVSARTTMGGPNVWSNEGGNMFSALMDQTLGTTLDRGSELGDFDGDGDPDLLVAHRNRTSQVLLNDGDGNFDVEPLGTTLGQAFNILGADLNNDGVMDLFRGNAGMLQVWFGE